MECDNASASADTTFGLGLNFLALVEVASLFVEVAVICVCTYKHNGRGFRCELKSRTRVHFGTCSKQVLLLLVCSDVMRLEGLSFYSEFGMGV